MRRHKRRQKLTRAAEREIFRQVEKEKKMKTLESSVSETQFSTLGGTIIVHTLESITQSVKTDLRS